MLQLRKDPLARVRELRARYGGFLRLGPLGRRELFLLSDPAAIRHVLLDNYKNYKKGLNARRLRPILGSGSLLLEGETWRRRRKLVQPAFHKQKIASLASAFVEATDRAIAGWPKTIDAREEMLRLTMGLTLRNMFGADAQELRALVDAWHVIYDSLAQSPIDRLRRRTTVERALATVREMLDKLIREKADRDDGTVLAMLLRSRDESGALTEAELRDEVMTIFVGGYETSSNALAFALANIAAFPEHGRKQREEVERLAGRAPTIDDLAALPYTRALLDETLRQYPPSWMITREAIADDEITGFRVRAGAQLLLSSYATHHAPDLWPEPERFRPERFLPGAPEPPRFAYFPFGGGPRICLGDQYALTEMQLVLARIAQRVSIELAPGTTIAARAQIGLRPREPLRLIVQERN